MDASLLRLSFHGEYSNSCVGRGTECKYTRDGDA